MGLHDLWRKKSVPSLLELDPRYQEQAESLRKISFRTPAGALVPLEEVVNIKQDVGPQSVNHYGQLPAVNISFGLRPGMSLGTAIDHINEVARHPVTILSGLPPAALGGLLTLWLFGNKLNIYSFVGLILLIGLVMKNAIMQIDFALDAERQRIKTPTEAIYEGCIIRFRPIMMTSMATMFGALPRNTRPNDSRVRSARMKARSRARATAACGMPA